MKITTTFKIGSAITLHILICTLLFSSCNKSSQDNTVYISSQINTTTEVDIINTTTEVDIINTTTEVDIINTTTEIDIINTTSNTNTTAENNVSIIDTTSQTNTNDINSNAIKSLMSEFDYLEQDYYNGANIEDNYSNTHIADVDFDGIVEHLTIEFIAQLERDGITNPLGITYKEVTFKVNNIEKTCDLGSGLTTRLFITDFNVKDAYKDICVITGGHDIARQFTIYRFNGSEIEEYASFSGAFDILYYDTKGMLFYNDDGMDEKVVNKYFDYVTKQSADLEEPLF